MKTKLELTKQEWERLEAVTLEEKRKALKKLARWVVNFPFIGKFTFIGKGTGGWDSFLLFSFVFLGNCQYFCSKLSSSMEDKYFLRHLCGLFFFCV